MQCARSLETRSLLFSALRVSVISISLNLPHAAMQGLSKSGVLLQSVLIELEFQMDFEECMEGFPRVVWRLVGLETFLGFEAVCLASRCSWVTLDPA